VKKSQQETEKQNYLKQIQQQEIDIERSNVKIKELDNKLKLNENTIKNYEKEVADLKQKEKDFNIKVENIKEQYKKSSEEEIKKIKKGLLKQIGDKLNTEKKNFPIYIQSKKIFIILNLMNSASE
jgi:hypothetical protein